MKKLDNDSRNLTGLFQIHFRFFLKIIFTAAAMTGCISQGAAESPGQEQIIDLPTMMDDDMQLEIMSPWTGGGGKDAMDALIEFYEIQHPGTMVIHSADSGLPFAELIAEFDRRLDAQQPFDSWQVHPGDQVRKYVTLGQVEPVTRLFEYQGLDQVMPPLLVDRITIGEEIYSIPVNIHRSNVLWYNPVIFQRYQLAPPTTLEEFFGVAAELESRGIVPVAVGGTLGFEVGHIFESILLAVFGPEDYLRLFQAGTTLWEDPRATNAIRALANLLAHTNKDFLEITLGDAAQMVADGEAGMTIMGDWVEGHLKTRGAIPGKDFRWIPFPGTAGNFIWISDGFVLATGAAHRDAALAWLEVVGSREGQDIFNPIKGSIPARLDADKELYDEYQQWSIDQFASNDLVPSLVHGGIGTEAYRIAYGDALTAFSKDLDEEKLLMALQSAALLLGE